MSLGPRIWTAWGELWSPYSTVQTIVPGFSTIRLPARFTIIAHLGASLLVGVGVAALGRSLPRMSALLLSVGAVIALLLPGLALPTLPSHPEAVGDDVPGVYRWLAGRDDGRAVLEIPQARDPAENSLRGYFSTFHWHPIVDGYAANAPLHRRYLHWIARRLPAEDALQELVDLADIGWLIVQRDALPEFARPLWNAPLPAGLTLVERWNETELYSVTRPPRENKRDRLLSDTRTIEGTQIAPIATPCSGSIELSRWIAAPLVAGEDARAVIKITNQSDETWPAFGFYPRGLVRLHGSLTDSTRHSVGDPIDPMIPSDLHPHRSVELQFQFKVPSSGAYSLRLELLQDSGMPLERCGTPPLVLELVVP